MIRRNNNGIGKKNCIKSLSYDNGNMPVMGNNSKFSRHYAKNEAEKHISQGTVVQHEYISEYTTIFKYVPPRYRLHIKGEYEYDGEAPCIEVRTDGLCNHTFEGLNTCVFTQDESAK